MENKPTNESIPNYTYTANVTPTGGAPSFIDYKSMMPKMSTGGLSKISMDNKLRQSTEFKSSTSTVEANSP